MQTIPKTEINEWDMLFETIESGGITELGNFDKNDMYAGKNNADKNDMYAGKNNADKNDMYAGKNNADKNDMYAGKNIMDKNDIPIKLTPIHKMIFSDDAIVFDKYEPENNTCKNCGQDMFVNSDMMLCKNCGMEVKNDTAVGIEEHTSAKTNNVNANGYLSLKIVGKGNYIHQKNMYKTSSNYPQKSRIDILRELKRYNDHSETIKFPLDILHQTCEMFSNIKKSGMIFRKDGKRGVLAACIYYASYMAGITKTPIEIAIYIGIDEKFYIQGERIVRELSEQKFITIPQKINPTNDYIERYTSLLGIVSEEKTADDARYKAFIIDIIARAEKYKLHIINDSKPNTKAIGVIYLLTLREKKFNHIKAPQIESTCNISRNTYMKYYELIMTHHKIFKKSFKKYKISMPYSWKI